MQKAYILFHVRDPDAMALNAEAPVFALYEDGSVVYQHRKGVLEGLASSLKVIGSDQKGSVRRLCPPFRFVQLNESERKSFLNMAAELAAVNDKYDPETLSCHAPASTLKIETPELQKHILVRGSYNDVPQKLSSALRRMSSFHHRDETPWMPERLEVFIWPFEYSKKPPIEWPSGWPDWTDTNHALNTGPNNLAACTDDRDADCYSIFLPISCLEEVDALEKQQAGLTAVRIGGKKWSMHYRFPFPHEVTEITPEYQARVSAVAAERHRLNLEFLDRMKQLRGFG